MKSFSSQFEECIIKDFLINQTRIPSETPDLHSGIVLVCEKDSKKTKTDSTFVIHNLLRSYLDQGVKVCLVSTSQSFNHYSSVLQKLGVDLRTLKDSNSFIFLDGLNFLGQSVLNLNTTSSDKTDSDNNTQEKEAFNRFIKHNSLQELSRLVGNSIKELKNDGKKVAVIIDNVGIFLTLGISVCNVVAFTQDLLIQLNYCHIGPLIIMSSYYGEDDENNCMVKFLKHLCTVSIEIGSLPSGISKDVHGQIEICRKPKLCDIDNTPLKKTFQFKISDKTVQLFAVGLSSAVL